MPNANAILEHLSIARQELVVLEQMLEQTTSNVSCIREEIAKLKTLSLYVH